MKKSGLGILMVVVLMLAAVQVQAFDGDRKGFMLNLGAGLGKAEMTVSAGSVSASLDATGFGGDFKLGGGINSQTMIYYTNRTLFYSLEVPGTNLSSNLINGMSAVGVSYFLEPQAPSFFFTGGVGIGVLLDSEASESDTGFGFTGGIGFEFAKNWIVEATYMSAKVAEEGDADASISNLMLTVSWFAY